MRCRAESGQSRAPVKVNLDRPRRPSPSPQPELVEGRRRAARLGKRAVVVLDGPVDHLDAAAAVQCVDADAGDAAPGDDRPWWREGHPLVREFGQFGKTETAAIKAAAVLHGQEMPTADRNESPARPGTEAVDDDGVA